MNPTAPLSITVGDGMCFFLCFLSFCGLHFSKVVSLHFDAGCVFVSPGFPFFFFFAGHVIPQRELAARQL
jgi:hypothetical protein